MEYRYTYTDDCIFKGACPREQKHGCSVDCTIQPEFYYLLHNSNIPEMYKEKSVLYPSKSDVPTFSTLAEIKTDIEVFTEEGRFLYLWGQSAGSGKSTWACKLLKTYLAVICVGNAFKDRAWFEYIPSFLLLAKDFNNPVRDIHIEALTTRDLVVLDDMGAVHNSQYDITVLSDIINKRYSNGKATIITSNVSPDKLRSGFERMADRLCSDIVLEIKGKGRRQSVSNYKRKGDNE